MLILSMSRRSLAVAIASVASFAMMPSVACSQTAAPDPVLTGRPDAATPNASDPNATSMLGPVFESLAAGIQFRSPIDSKETRRVGGDEVVQFENEKLRWVLTVNKLTFKQPISMTYHQVDGHDVNGLLEQSVDQLKSAYQKIDIKRQDVVRTGQLDIAMIAGKYNVGNEGDLALVGLVREIPADSSKDVSYQYYSFNLTAIVPKDDKWEESASAKNAVMLFQQVIDSIRLLDQTQLRQDQNERLFRTRSLFVNLTETRITQSLVKEQWLRLIRDGKDIGYTYVVEETGRDLPRAGRKGMQQTGGSDGVLIGVRSRTLPEAGVQVDSESWMWASFDRAHEKWSNIAVIDNKKTGKAAVGEGGSSDREIHNVSDPTLEMGESYKGRDGSTKVDKNQPQVRQQEVMTLSVTPVGRNKAQPLSRVLPPWYLSQALGHLLPRLLATHQGSSYMFATYNSEAREVMMRYVEVDHEGPVDLGGQTVRAIPIRDRLGLEGTMTTHYVSPQGKYLGSINPDSKITILASDAETIEKIWRDANLSRPGDVETSGNPAPTAQ